MSFVAVAVGVVGEGVAANLLAGAMMGATTTVAGNVIGGRDPFDNIGRGALMGGLTGGLTPGVKEAFEIGMPAAAGITAFGLNTLATGDLGKGLMAGATAYGLYGLSENMTAAGGNALIGDATGANSGILMSDLMAEQGIYPTLESGAVNPEYISEINKTTANAISQGRNAALPEKLSRGFDAAKAAPGTFFKDNAKYLMYAAGPILADQAVKSNMPTTTTRPGAVRTFSYNPYDQLYTPTGNYEVPVKAAGGGLMGMNDGGYSPGQLDFMQRSEPVVRMASGGIVGYAAGGVSDADVLGWFNENPNADDSLIAQTMQQANVTPEQVARATGTDYSNVNQRYLDAIAASTPVTAAPVITAPTQIMDTSGGGTNYQTVNDLYQGVLGRGVESEGAAGYWQNLFGPTIDANEVAQFQTAAQAELAGRNAGATGGLNALATTPAFSNQYTFANINDYIANNNLDATGIAAAAKQFNVDPAQVVAAQDAQSLVSNVFRNVLGRDPDPNGLDYWTNEIMSGRSTGQDMLNTFIKNAKANNEIIANPNIKLEDAVKDFGGYKSSNARDIADEWVRNTLGREVTETDRKQQWYKDAVNDAVMNTYGKAQDIYGDFKTYAQQEAAVNTTKAINDAKASLAARGLTEADVVKQTRKTIAELVAGSTNLGLDLYQASQLKAPGAASKFDFSTIEKAKVIPPVVGGGTSVIADGFYGNTTNPGDITRNADGTSTVHPNIPYRPVGGFSGMGEVKNAYTTGGGSLGYVPYAPKTMEEFESKYGFKTPSGSKSAYDYLTGKTKYSATPYTETGEVMKPYSEAVLGVPRSTSSKQVLFDPVTKTYKPNPDYIPVSYTSKGEKVYGLSSKDIASQLPDVATSDYGKWMAENNVTLAQIAQALGISLAEAKKRYGGTKATTETADTSSSYVDAGGTGGEANGGLMKLARGGMAQQFDLGGYSDGGRLLRGPGDGVSDSIPATIGNKRPARLADGEFVVPARIVSELGNGSTEAGARKLYAMMDRVQSARRGTVGKGKVAKNSRSDKHLPA